MSVDSTSPEDVGSETKLYLIRHAKALTNANPDYVAGRSHESRLVPTGRHQALALGVAMQRIGLLPETAYASEAARAQETGSLALGVAAVRRLTAITVEPRLNEMSQGGWEGRLRRGEYEEQMFAGLEEDPLNYKARHPDGDGESKLEVAERMFAYAEEIRLKHPGEEVAAFTHRMAIACLLAKLEDWPDGARDPRGFPSYAGAIDNASTTLLRHDGQEWHIEFKGTPPGGLLA